MVHTVHVPLLRLGAMPCNLRSIQGREAKEHGRFLGGGPVANEDAQIPDAGDQRGQLGHGAAEEVDGGGVLGVTGGIVVEERLLWM